MNCNTIERKENQAYQVAVVRNQKTNTLKDLYVVDEFSESHKENPYDERGKHIA